MILWNGMWHGLRNDIIMWNLICGKWRKEKIQQESMCASLPRYFFAPIRAGNRFAGPFIAMLKLKHS